MNKGEKQMEAERQGIEIYNDDHIYTGVYLRDDGGMFALFHLVPPASRNCRVTSEEESHGASITRFLTSRLSPVEGVVEYTLRYHHWLEME